jgi:hypothetical protein
MRRLGRTQLRIAADPLTWSAVVSNVRWGLAEPCAAPVLCQAVQRNDVVRWPKTYQHPGAAPFVQPIKQGFASVASVVPTDIAQTYEGIVLIEVDQGDGLRRVAIDYSDFTFVNEQCVSEADVYFKLQYLRDGYPAFSNVVPGGYVTSSPFLYAHWCRLRTLRFSSRPTSDVFGRFGLRYSAQVRRDAVERVASDPRLVFVGGTRPTQQTRYLREMARARVCLDLPGQGPFCYRLVECLAMGCCIVGPRHATRLPVDLQNETEIVCCADDLRDLSDLCVAYSRDETKRAAVGAAAARYFDENLHPVRMAERYLTIVRDGTPSLS